MLFFHLKKFFSEFCGLKFMFDNKKLIKCKLVEEAFNGDVNEENLRWGIEVQEYLCFGEGRK